MEAEQSGEGEDHPKNTRREIAGRDRRRIPGEVKDDDRKQCERERREKRAARSKLDCEVLAGNESRRDKRSGNARRAHRSTASRYTSRYVSSAMSPRSASSTNWPSRMMAVCVASASPSPRWWVTRMSAAPSRLSR